MSSTGTQAREPPVLPAALGELLQALDREGVPWSLLRPSATIALPEGDVDLLVTPAAFDNARDIIARQGFVAIPATGPDLHAAVYDERAARFVWLHVQTALRVAGAILPAEAVLAEAERDGIRQPGEAWLLWILLLRALVDKGELPERHRPHLRALARRWRTGPPALEALARARGLDPREVVAAAAAGDWDALLRHSVHQPAAPAAWPRRLLGMLAQLRRVPDRRGLTVAVIGPDGAGKTTLVEGLQRSLPLPTRVLYMGLTGGRLPKADALRVPGLVLGARIIILWVRYLCGAYHRARGRIVLFDRYTLDGAVPAGVRLSLLARFSRRVQERSIPLPDLVLLLDASGATMHARKGEYRPAVLDVWRAAYGHLRARVPSLEVLDAEQSAEQVRRDAEARIWRRYGEVRAVAAGRRLRR